MGINFRALAATAVEHSGPWYHGTTVPNLRHVLPVNQHRKRVSWPEDTSHEHAYATSDEDDAWEYAQAAWHDGGGRPRVYEVHPKGHVEQDPSTRPDGSSRGDHERDYRSKDGFNVVRELPFPHDWRREDWE
jgi:hypothetical protein